MSGIDALLYAQRPNGKERTRRFYHRIGIPAPGGLLELDTTGAAISL
jgi:hypothetical protein